MNTDINTEKFKRLNDFLPYGLLYDFEPKIELLKGDLTEIQLIKNIKLIEKFNQVSFINSIKNLNRDEFIETVEKHYLYFKYNHTNEPYLVNYWLFKSKELILNSKIEPINKKAFEVFFDSKHFPENDNLKNWKDVKYSYDYYLKNVDLNISSIEYIEKLSNKFYDSEIYNICHRARVEIEKGITDKSINTTTIKIDLESLNKRHRELIERHNLNHADKMPIYKAYFETMQYLYDYLLNWFNSVTQSKNEPQLFTNASLNTIKEIRELNYPRYSFNYLNELIERCKNDGYSIQPMFDKYGCFEINNAKVYSIELAMLFLYKDVKVLNLETKEIETISGYDYLQTFTDGYREGEQKIKPNESIIYGSNADSYILDLLNNYFHNPIGIGRKGWGYVKRIKLISFTHKDIWEFGYYSGIVSVVDKMQIDYKKQFEKSIQLQTVKPESKEIVVPENKHANIFENSYAYQIFLAWHEKFKEIEKNHIANYSYLIRIMIKDKLIKDIKQSNYLEFLSQYGINLTRLKTINDCETADKKTIYLDTKKAIYNTYNYSG